MRGVWVPSFSGTTRRGRLLAAVAAGILLSGACTSAQVTETRGGGEMAFLGVDEPQLGKELAPGGSFVGNYLAGRHAQSVRESETAIQYFRTALAKDPDNNELKLRTGVLLVSEGEIQEAVPLLESLSGSEVANSIVEMVLSIYDAGEGKFAASSERLEGLADNGLNQFVKPLLQAWAVAGTGDTVKAVDILQGVRQTNGAEVLHDLHAALIYDLAGQEAEALQAFERALGNDRLSYGAVSLFGEFLERSGRIDQARELYTRFDQEHPDSELLDPALARLDAGESPPRQVKTGADGMAQAVFDLAGVFRQQNAREMALIFGRLALWLRPDFPPAQILIGDILEASDRPAAANVVYEAIDKKSQFSWSARLRAALNLDDLDRPDEAMVLLKSMAAERPVDPQPLITLGNILRARERFDEAVGIYDEAINRIGTLEKRHWSLLYSRGMALERSKQWDRAEADFLQALEFEPEQPYVLNYLGYSWVDKGLHLDRAMKMIGKAVELRPNDGYIVDSLGWAHYRLGNMTEAVRELERAVELRPEDPIINDHLGDAYWWVGRKREARFQWLRSKNLNPEPDLAATLEEKLTRGLTEKKDVPGQDG